MKSLNPSCKLIGLLLLTVLLPLLQSYALNFAVFGVCTLAILWSDKRPKRYFIAMFPVLLAATGMFFTGYYYHAASASPVHTDTLGLGNAALINGLMLSSRILVIAGLGFLFAMTTEVVSLVSSLQQQLRLPALFAYGLLAAWGIFPNMLNEYRRARIAFRARGIRTFIVSPALLRPLLVKSVRWSECLAVAMESKGFSGNAPRTIRDKLHLRPADILFPVVLLLFWIAAFIQLRL